MWQTLVGKLALVVVPSVARYYLRHRQQTKAAMKVDLAEMEVRLVRWVVVVGLMIGGVIVGLHFWA